MKINIIILFTFFISFNGISQWNLMDHETASNDNYFMDMQFVNKDTGFVIGVVDFETAILRTLDGGVSWDTTNIDDIGIDYVNFSTLHFPNDTIGYIAGSGEVIKTIDCGETWFTLDPEDIWNAGFTWRAIQFVNKDTGFIAYQDGGSDFLRTYDGGITWFEDPVMTGIRNFNENNGIYTGCWGGWAILNNETLEWTVSGSNLIDGGHVFHNSTFNNGVMFVVGKTPTRGLIGYSNDTGETWRYRQFNVLRIYKIQFLNDNIGYCSGWLIGTLKTFDNGETWWQMELNNYDTDIGKNFEQFQMINDTLGYGISQGGFYKTTNGGGTPQYEIISEDFVSVDENAAIDLNVYPNPTMDQLTIQTNGITLHKVKIFDLNGKLLLDEILNSNTINTADLPFGQYILKIFSDESVYEVQFVKE